MTTTTTMDLETARFIDLTTFRRTGEPVRTPVLLIPDGDRLLVRTAAESGKLKRIRHTPRVEVTPSDQRGRHLGATVTGTASILGPAAVPPTLARLHARYRIAGPLFSAIRRLRGQPDVIIEITLDRAARPAPAMADRPVVDVDDVRRARVISGVTAAIAAALFMGACAATPAASEAPTPDAMGASMVPATAGAQAGRASAGIDSSDGTALCAAVSRDAVERAVGMPVGEGIPVDQGIVSGASCRYASVDGRLRVRVWVHRPIDRAAWDAAMAKLEMTDGERVDDLGESALVLTGSPARPHARLSAFADDHDVWVDVLGAPTQVVATAAARTLAGDVLAAFEH